MRVDFVRLFGISRVTCGLIALTSSAGASVTEHCGSVSYTYPDTDDHGHAALSNLTAASVPCTKARSVAKAFLIACKAPCNDMRAVRW